MKGLMKKVRGDKKGFTLAELLVVVAIIGILVAVSVPIFTAQLGKARFATNEANLRAAKAAAIAEYLTAQTGENSVTTGEYVYNVADGTIKKVGNGTGEANTVTGTDVANITDASSTTTYKLIQVHITNATTGAVSYTVQ